MTNFEKNATYLMKWITNADAKTFYKIIKRTAKTVTIQEIGQEKQTTCRVYIYDNQECIKPFGNYSMCPVLKAGRKVIN